MKKEAFLERPLGLEESVEHFRDVLEIVQYLSIIFNGLIIKDFDLWNYERLESSSWLDLRHKMKRYP